MSKKKYVTKVRYSQQLGNSRALDRTLSGSLEQQAEEALPQYLWRVYVYSAGMIGLLEMYEKELPLQRSKELHPLSMACDKNPSSALAQQLRKFAARLQRELYGYTSRFPAIAKSEKIIQRTKDLESLLRGVQLTIEPGETPTQRYTLTSTKDDALAYALRDRIIANNPRYQKNVRKDVSKTKSAQRRKRGMKT